MQLPTSPQEVLDNRILEWHFHIYFLTQSSTQEAHALALRTAILSLRRAGVFVAVPLFRVNHGPMGPHPVSSYEIWVPASSFADVYSYLALNRGELSILIHPLTREERKDHEIRRSWLGPSYPLHLDSLPVRSDEVPLQYPTLGLGYSNKSKEPTLDEREEFGRLLEEKLKGEPEAAPADEQAARKA